MRRPAVASRWTGLWGYVLIFCYVIGTNWYYGMTTDRKLIDSAAGDVWSYRSIAEAAPYLPGPPALPFHHAQRFFVPAVVGMVAKTFDLPSETVARAAVVLLFIGCLALTRSLFVGLGASATAAWFLASLVFLNPYGVRLVLAFPFMLNDLTCVFGMIMALVGLRQRCMLFTILGATIAVLARQTGLALLLPFGVVAFFELRRRPRSRFLWALVASAILLVSIYVLTASIATKMARPSRNVELLLGLATWVRDAFDAKQLLEFLVRGAAAHLVVWAALVALLTRPSAWRRRSSAWRRRSSAWRRRSSAWRRRSSAWRRRPFDDDTMVGLAFLLAAAGVFLQPLLIGPGAMGNLQRLTVLGLWPLVMGSYLLFPRSYEAFFSDVRSRMVPLALLVLYSQHHLFSWPGKLLMRHPEAFFATQGLVAVGMYVWVKHVRRRECPTPSPARA